jgi:sporulation protein YlmC with PRC-barrel domain
VDQALGRMAAPTAPAARAVRGMRRRRSEPALGIFAKVVDDAGTLLGTPQAIAIAPQTGRLQQLEVHSGGMLGMGGQTTTVPGSDVTSVGADVIVVRASSRPA